MEYDVANPDDVAREARGSGRRRAIGKGEGEGEGEGVGMARQMTVHFPEEDAREEADEKFMAWHARAVIEFAASVLDATAETTMPNGKPCQVRIGIHSGECNHQFRGGL